MRRLPVFFVLDVSESMLDDNLQKMDYLLDSIVKALRQDPHALETVYLSVIAFAGVARTLAPLVDVLSFYPPKLPLGSGTALGGALYQLMEEIDRQVAKTTPVRKGDWKPVVYIFTDGKPTDAVDAAIARFHRDYARRADLVAVALGRYADLSVLKRLTEHVFLFEDGKDGDFARFVKWVTASISMQSQTVGDAQNKVSLAKIDDTILSLVKDMAAAPATTPDSDCVALVGRCQKTRKPYLMKYDRMSAAIATLDFAFETRHFELAGCYPIDESYFDWSDLDPSTLKTNTAELLGIPGCPHCGNGCAFAKCHCGELLCINGPGLADCPWCSQQVNFDSGSDAGFDVRRGRG